MSENYSYLDDERKKLWQAVRDIETKLNELIKSTPLQLQQEARGQIKKASEYCNRITERKAEADAKTQDITNLISSLQTTMTSLSQKLSDIEKKHDQIVEQFNTIQDAYDIVRESNDEWNNQASSINQNFTTSNEWIENARKQAEKVQAIHSICESNEKKINGLLTQAADRKKEIVDVRDEIFGYDYEDENTGEKKHEDGLLEELQNSYNDLTKKLTNFNESLESFKTEKEKEYNSFIQFKKSEHEAIQNKIKELLPGALTTGLSYAYNEQCNEEKKERFHALIAFYISIAVMIACAVIPVYISYSLKYNSNKSIEEIITYFPQLLCIILPLYLPVLWVAFSSSRKANLSKRLIEEYAHKVTLSKTFQGLEGQIAELGNSATALDLKVKLLYNLVAISAENPGELIPNYNKADNPLIELMDKSIAFSESLEKLKNIPGISIIAKHLIQKERAKQSEIAEKAMNDASDQ